MKKRLALVIAICSGLAACGQDLHYHSDELSAKQLFDKHCASCHLSSGKGKFLSGVPANKGTSLSSMQVYHKIKSKKNANMPTFNNMSDAEAIKIANYVKNL